MSKIKLRTDVAVYYIHYYDPKDASRTACGLAIDNGKIKLETTKNKRRVTCPGCKSRLVVKKEG